MTHIPSEDIKTIIFKILDKYGWDRKTLAYKLEVSPETVSRWLNGRNNIHEKHYEALRQIETSGHFTDIKPKDASGELLIPITIKLKRSHLKMSIDAAGDVNIETVVSITLKG